MYANAYALVANQVLSAALGLLYWTLAAHLYGTETVGVSSAAISALVLISGIAQLGLGGGMARFLPRAGPRTRRIIVLTYGVVIASSVLLSIAFIALNGVLGLHGLLGTGTQLWVWTISAAVLWSIFRLQDQVLIGLRQAKWVLIENTIYNVAKILFLVAGASVLARAGIVGSWFLPTPIVIVLVTFVIFGVYARTNRLTPAPAGLAPLTVREIATTSAGDHIGSLIGEAAQRLLPVVVLATLGATASAYFWQAWLVATTLSLLAGGMTDSFTAESAADRANIGRYSRDIMEHMALLIVPVSVVLGISAPLILSIFGKTYAAEGTTLLRLLCLASPLIAFNTWYLAYARVMGRIRQVIWVQAVGSVLLLGLSYVLLLPLGIAGVGIAAIVSQLTVSVIGVLDSRDVLFSTAAAGADPPAGSESAQRPLTAPAKAVFVSPHLDDAVLSCGGGITHLVHAGVEVTITTIFTGDQPLGEPLSTLARRSHSSWSAGNQPFSIRRDEDEAAAQLLGVKTEHLGLLDAIYRRSPSGHALYRRAISDTAPDDLTSSLPRIEKALLESRVCDASISRVFCPGGIGGHPDHVLTRRAVENLVAPERIVYYDEYPYSSRRAAFLSANHLDSLPVQTLALTAEEIHSRIEATGRYSSQLRGLFPTMYERVWEMALGVPIVGRRLVRAPNIERSRARMAVRVEQDIADASGERYRWPAACDPPFPLSHGTVASPTYPR